MNTSKFFELAELAEASYANLWDADKSKVITGKDDVKDALKLNGFSESQATEFTTNWEVVSGGHLPNTASGYSGTLFRRLTDDPVSGFKKGQYVYAPRGSEGVGSNDVWQADIGNIVADGLALNNQ